MNFIQKIPWRLKFLGAAILNTIPKSYTLLRKFNIGRHGAMDNREYALNSFLRFYNEVDFSMKGKSFSALELGPGDSLFSGIITSAFGASKTYLVDVGDFAIKEIITYKKMVEYLQSKGYSIKNVDNIRQFNQLLKEYDIEYITTGLDGMKTIPDNSIDFLWSNAVLEHVHRNNFLKLIKEFRRILSKDGICCHTVGLMDHFTDSLNNLRVPTFIWESRFFKGTGVYTNRIRYSEMIKIFETLGFKIIINNQARWKYLPLSQEKMLNYFKKFSLEDLKVSKFFIALKKTN